MTPPDHHIRIVERRLVEALRRRSQGNTLDGETRLSGEVHRDGFAEEFFSVGAFLFRLLLVPHQDPHGAGSSGAGRDRRRKRKGEKLEQPPDCAEKARWLGQSMDGLHASVVIEMAGGTS